MRGFGSLPVNHRFDAGQLPITPSAVTQQSCRRCAFDAANARLDGRQEGPGTPGNGGGKFGRRPRTPIVGLTKLEIDPKNSVSLSKENDAASVDLIDQLTIN